MLKIHSFLKNFKNAFNYFFNIDSAFAGILNKLLIVFTFFFSNYVSAEEKVAVSIEPSWTKWSQNSIDWGLNNYGISAKYYSNVDLFGEVPKLFAEGTKLERLEVPEN